MTASNRLWHRDSRYAYRQEDKTVGDIASTYYGFAPIGSVDADPVWQIFLMTVTTGTTTITSITFPIDTSTDRPTDEFKFAWSNRASLTYV